MLTKVLSHSLTRSWAGPLTSTMLTTTANEFRPNVGTSSHATEDLQPNEAINKRQRVAPPTVLSASVKQPLPYKTYALWRHSSGGESNGSGIRQLGTSRGRWTQQAVRGNKSWRGKFSARGGDRHTTNSPTWNHLPFSAKAPPTNTQFPVAANPLIFKPYKPDRPNPPPHPRPPVDPPLTTKSLTISHSQPPATSSSIMEQLTTKHPPELNTSTAKSPAPPNAQQGTPQHTEAPKQPLKFKHINLAPKSLPQTFSEQPTIPPPILKRSSPSPVIMAQSSTPPFKRRKLGHTPEPSTVIKVEPMEAVALSPHPEPHSHATPEDVKAETRTPSPPPRRLVKESCNFYPLPDDCRKSNPDHRKNRQAFFVREYNVLKYLGLKRTKVIFRFVTGSPFPHLWILIVR